MQNVLTAIFEVESQGYQAMTEIRQDLAREKYFVPQMALVKKVGDELKTLDSYQSPLLEDGHTFGGGLFGSMLGIIGGPLGVLLGGSWGALAGAVADSANSDSATSLLDEVSNRLDDGLVAIVALVSEDDESQLDAILGKFQAYIMRRDMAFVAEEVEKKQALAREIKKEQTKEEWEQKKLEWQASLESKHNELKAAIQQKGNELKADFEAFRAKFQK